MTEPREGAPTPATWTRGYGQPSPILRHGCTAADARGEFEAHPTDTAPGSKMLPDTAGLELACGKPTNGSWYHTPSWRVLPEPELGCHERGVYTVILSGEAYVDQVECTHRQLNRWRRTCPLLVFHDDQAGKQLPGRAIKRLETAVGPAHVRPASWLLSLGNLSASTVVKAGRRLLQHQGTYLLWGTLTKICMFLLPYRRVVFLDLDLVLLRPLDALLALPLPRHTHFAATGVGSHCGLSLPWEPFNGGMEVFRPNHGSFERLMLRLCL